MFGNSKKKRDLYKVISKFLEKKILWIRRECNYRVKNI